MLDCIVRGTTLSAAYGETSDHPVRVDAAWRVLPPLPEQGFFAAVDLTLSVHTSLLDSRPALVARSRLVAGEVLRLTGADTGVFDPVSFLGGASPVCLPEGGPSCLVFRPLGDGPSYIEMVHPADFQHDELLGSPKDHRKISVSHRLFAERLEKGVPLHPEVVDWFKSICAEMEIEFDLV